MATFNFRPDSKRSKDGSYVILVYINSGDTTTKLSTKLYISNPSRWNAKKQILLGNDSLNEKLAELKLIFSNIIIHLNSNVKASEIGRLFKDAMTCPVPIECDEKTTMFSNVWEYVDVYKGLMSPNTMTGYQFSQRTFYRYLKSIGLGDLSLKSTTKDIIRNYLLFLKGKQYKQETIWTKVRDLRSVLNKWLNDDKEDADQAARILAFFKDKTIARICSQPRGRKSPDSLSANQVAAIMIKDFGDQSVNMARDIFIFSLYCIGINPIDLFRLKVENIKSTNNGNFLEYERSKTANYVRVPMSSVMLEILSRYYDGSSEYLFPFINHFKTYKGFYRCYMDFLKTVFEDTSVNCPISSNLARYTWSALCDSESDVVDVALAHSTKSIAATRYMRKSFNDIVIANDKFQDSIDKERVLLTGVLSDILPGESRFANDQPQVLNWKTYLNDGQKRLVCTPLF